MYTRSFRDYQTCLRSKPLDITSSINFLRNFQALGKLTMVKDIRLSGQVAHVEVDGHEWNFNVRALVLLAKSGKGEIYMPSMSENITRIYLIRCNIYL